MFFHIFDDGWGGFYIYETSPGLEAFADISTPLLELAFIVIPIATLIIIGPFIAIPAVLLLLGLMLGLKALTGGNTIFSAVKAALAVPLLAYAAVCIPYVMGKANEGIGPLVLLTAVIGLAGMVLLVGFTMGAALPLAFLWCGGFMSAFGDGFPTLSNYLLRITDLAAPVVFIVFLVRMLKARKMDQVYFLPKAIGFGLGAAILVGLMTAGEMGLHPWMYAMVAIGLFAGGFLIYSFILRQPAPLADWIFYPFLLSLLGHVLATGSTAYLFPSEVLGNTITLLQPLTGLLEKATNVCGAFSEVLSDIIYAVLNFFIEILPDIGLHARHFEIPDVVGCAFMILVTGFIGSLIGTMIVKMAKPEKEK